MELGHLDGKKILNIQESGKMIVLREKVHTRGQTDEVIMVNGKITKWKEKDYLCGQTAENIKVIFLIILNKDKVNILK